MNKELHDKVIAYNISMKEALSLIYNELNKGQQKKVLKNEMIKALLEKFHVI